MLVALMTLSGIALLPAPGQASCFSSPDERSIFVRADGISTARGTTNRIRVRDRNVESNCNSAETHSTAHLTAPDFGAQVEIGWWKKQNGNFYWFWEAQVDQLVFGGCCSGANAIPQLVGTAPLWRVSHHSDDSRWHVYIRTEQATQFEEFGHISDSVVGFSYGVPHGETSVRGTETHANDRHFELQYRPCASGACWSDWPGTLLRFDNLPGWHFEANTDTSYFVKAAS